MNRQYSKGGRPSRKEDEEIKLQIMCTVDEVIDKLGNPNDSLNLANKIISSPIDAEIRSTTSYLKIHDLFSNALDFILDAIDSDSLQSQLEQINQNLAKVKVIVNYQKIRGQITDNIAKVLDKAIDKLNDKLNSIKGTDPSDLKELRKLVENIRVVIDSFAVVAKRKRGE